MFSGYVTGEVFPIIQKMDKLTLKATHADKVTAAWNKRKERHSLVIWCDYDLRRVTLDQFVKTF